MAVAYVAHAHDAAGMFLGAMGTRQVDMEQLVRTLHSTATPLVVVDEAGPWGSWRSRDLTQPGHRCSVVAPSRRPQKPGDRVKTARRDAMPGARLRRSGDLPPGAVPTGAEEAMRDLGRARADARRDRTAAQCRLTAVWRRHDRRDTGRAPWPPAHLRWRREVVCPTPAPPMVWHADVRASTAHTDRRGRLEHARRDQGNVWRFPPGVAARHAWRGVPCTVAVTTVAALGDLPRVEPPRPRMQLGGRIPSAYARGERRRQGALPNAGHTPARRARVEAAWASRDPANVSRHVPRRLAPPVERAPGQPLEGTRAPVPTRSTPPGPGEACQPRRRGHGSGTGGLSVGHGPPRARDTRRPPAPSPWDEHGPCPSQRGQGASTTDALARTGRCPPVVRPYGHRPPRRRHAPAGGRVAGQPHASRRRVAVPSEPRPVPPARSGHRREPAVMAHRPEPLRRGVPASGRAAAPVWCPPRRREEAARTPRASSEAGT
jgi:hypothetical protein